MTAPTLRPFSRSLPMALLRAREAVMRHFRPLLKARNLTEQQWRVLRALDGLDGIDVTGLAARTFLLAPSLTRILRDLEARQLIRRRADPQDGRASVIALSAAGRRTLNEGGPESEAIYAQLEARIGKNRIDALMTMLQEIEAELGPSADETVDFSE
jgi:homoprotocatechuate degradation regulator HpaR